MVYFFSAKAPEHSSYHKGVEWTHIILVRATSEVMLTHREKINATRAKIRHRIVLQADHDSLTDFAFTIPVNAALRDRGNEVISVIIAELKSYDGQVVMAWSTNLRPCLGRA